VESHPRLHNTIKKNHGSWPMWDFQSQFDILACKMVDVEKGYPKEFPKQIVVGVNNVVLY
jgi:hypothetical protein